MLTGQTYSRTFENRDLGQWLLQLVGKEPDQRKAAAKVISGRFRLPGELDTDDFESPGEIEPVLKAHTEAFENDLRETLGRRSFPAAGFARDLLALDLALHDSWCAEAKAERQRENALDEAERAKLGDHPTAAARKRYLRGIQTRLQEDFKRIAEEEPHEAVTTGLTIALVIGVLGKELLPAADIIRKMLSHPQKAYVASGIISRMGRDGLEFYDDLLAGMNGTDANSYCARALGAVLQAAPEKIPEMLRLACESTGALRLDVLTALGTCGRGVTAACPEAEVRLQEMLRIHDAGRDWYAIVSTLGAVGRTAVTVTALLERINPADAEKTGAIIDALGDLGLEPERVLPRLIELLDTFKEFDPDWAYHGEHGRIVRALEQFGVAAAVAVPALVQRIWTPPQQYWTKDHQLAERPEPDQAVIALLGKLGPLAKPALPALLELQTEMRRRAEEGRPKSKRRSTRPAPFDDASWDIAIRQIQEM